MFFRFFYELFILVTVVMIMTLTIGRSTTAGILERCDLVADCTTERATNLDNSWLCCEDERGWPAAHIVNPLSFLLLSGSPEYTFAAYFLFEAFEAIGVANLKTFVFVPADPANLELLPGSLIGDALINGSLGLLLGVSIAVLVGWDGFLTYYTAMRFWIKIKYLALLVCFSALYTIGGQTAGTFNFGLLIVYVLDSIAILFIIPLIIRPNDVPGVDLATPYWRLKWFWFAAITLIMPTGMGFRYMANYWFQCWTIAYPLIVLVQLVLFARLYLTGTMSLRPRRVLTNSTSGLPIRIRK